MGDSWILQPEDPWEVTGYVHNVVFTCGAVAESDGTVKIYWGGADTVMCVGEANISDLVALCLDHPDHQNEWGLIYAALRRSCERNLPPEKKEMAATKSAPIGMNEPIEDALNDAAASHTSEVNRSAVRAAPRE